LWTAPEGLTMEVVHQRWDPEPMCDGMRPFARNTSEEM
jgi:hypothetical protein